MLTWTYSPAGKDVWGLSRKTRFSAQTKMTPP